MMWDDMKYWDSGEWQAVEEQLDDLEAKNIKYRPARENLFAALDACPLETCKVAILGQDPYPDATSATGLAFSIPPEQKTFPPTLLNIFKEYCEDLHYPFPTSGDLTPWASQGILLWNVVPTCLQGKPGSHRNWTEWSYLSQEIVQLLASRPVLLVAIGGIARYYIEPYLNTNEIISLAHPSPMAKHAKAPFHGSRLFTTINSRLSNKIDWRLP